MTLEEYKDLITQMNENNKEFPSYYSVFERVSKEICALHAEYAKLETSNLNPSLYAKRVEEIDDCWKLLRDFLDDCLFIMFD